MLKTSICSQYACVLVMLNLKPFECLLVLPAHDTFKISGKEMHKQRPECFVILNFVHP